jgi:hypothetical protein
MNRQQRRLAKRAAEGATPADLDREGFPCPWSVEIKAYGATIALILDHRLDHLPEHDARLTLSTLGLAMLLIGCRRGWWPPLPLMFLVPPPPEADMTLRTVEIAGETHTVLECGRSGHAVFCGEPQVARQLLITMVSALAEGRAKPTRTWNSGGFDERNLSPMARGPAGVA